MNSISLLVCPCRSPRRSSAGLKSGHKSRLKTPRMLSLLRLKSLLSLKSLKAQKAVLVHLLSLNLLLVRKRVRLRQDNPPLTESCYLALSLLQKSIAVKMLLMSSACSLHGSPTILEHSMFGGG